MNKMIITLALLTAFISGCTNTNIQDLKSPNTESKREKTSKIIDHNLSSSDAEWTLDALIPPDPIWHHFKLHVFAQIGIESFYQFKRRVPASYEEYLDSGIPMLVPNDYITGKPYVKVDKIDMSDSTGFTFETDGNESCKLEFVIINVKTNVREIRTFNLGKSVWREYKTGGLAANKKHDFDSAKREFCVFSFMELTIAYIVEFGKPPDTLAEMFKNEGPLIEKGWKWIPDNTDDKTDYFEFGVDVVKARYYLKYGCIGNCEPLTIMISELNFDISPRSWEYTSDDVIPPDVCNMNKFLSSDALYDGYVQIIAARKG